MRVSGLSGGKVYALVGQSVVGTLFGPGSIIQGPLRLLGA